MTVRWSFGQAGGEAVREERLEEDAIVGQGRSAPCRVLRGQNGGSVHAQRFNVVAAGVCGCSAAERRACCCEIDRGERHRRNAPGIGIIDGRVDLWPVILTGRFRVFRYE